MGTGGWGPAGRGRWVTRWPEGTPPQDLAFPGQVLVEAASAVLQEAQKEGRQVAEGCVRSQHFRWGSYSGIS